ncbi:zinc finger protein 382 isoform X2 [Bicyclus anynana]|uniref:Zinc finger protein 382 isoform X2 n=1 Tax=Bicyclus anynana TaxID=110368 RepID=A0A6J1N7I3_BICAN|nr:zinc finger protein 382 isoform X2 [Bicyclus anynana]
MDTQLSKRNCDEDSEMNFAAFQAVGGQGTHFVTTAGQMPVTKLQQNMTNNGNALSQVVGMVGGVNMGDGMQYVRAIDSSTIPGTPQLISVPIALPGTKPGDPQPTVQIQVLSPNVTLQQQQPKYQMQIPIQGFQQGGTVLTLAYSPDGNENGGFQLIGNSLPEGLQVLAAMPHEMQLIQPQQAQDSKEQVQQSMQHQVFITPNNQIIINGPDVKPQLTNNNPEISNIVIKEEYVENDDESSQGTETGDGNPWQIANSSQDLVKYLNTLPPQQNLEVMQMLLQQTQALPASLQQFLRLNPADNNKRNEVTVEVEMSADNKNEMLVDGVNEPVMDEEDNIQILNKKKKKYKKKPPKPARPRPGSIVIATATDGTPIFCCPECNMAYPEKEQLEMHLSVHKIERRFICGICGAGLKRKEHLERHKLGHNPERPYVCGICGKGFKRREHLNLHAVIHSGVKTEMCGQCGKGFYRKDHLRKHTRSHEYKTARAHHDNSSDAKTTQTTTTNNNITTSITANPNTILPEITIHVPTSSNMQVPVQINIPQHLMSSLAAQSAGGAPHDAADAHAALDALLAQHT